MSNINIKEGGSVWKVATFWGNENLPKDGCGLVWKLLFHTTIISILSAFVGVVLGDSIASLSASIVTGVWVWGIAVAIITFMCVILLGVGICALLVVVPIILWESSEEDSTHPVAKTIHNLKNIKRGWKEKYCPLVVEVK